jgi:hypothetical protein
MYVVGYTDTQDEWSIAKVTVDSLDLRSWNYAGREATLKDLDRVLTYYYEDYTKEEGIDYLYIVPEGTGIWAKNFTEAFDLGYRAIIEYMEEQNSEWEDDKYAEGNEW